jgi:uncharacterized LabA/DUF88 family protein
MPKLPTKKEPVIFAFIDSQNLNVGVKKQGWTVDFARFRVYLKEKYNVEKAYLFIGQIPGNESLYTSLQEAGYILVFKPTLEIKRGNQKLVKGNVDAELVLHAMLHYPTYSKAIIVSGDGDFHCLVEYLKKKDRLEKLLVPNRTKYSALFRKFSDDIEFISDLKKKIKK